MALKLHLEKKIEITGKHRVTNSKFWSELEVGDVLEMSIPVEWAPSDRKPKITVKKNGVVAISDTIVKVANGIEHFKYKELN